MTNHFTDIFENKLLTTWEEVYKKGQLTLWILLSLKAGSRDMTGIKQFIEHSTNGTLSVDDQSLYRALRRLHQMELTEYQEEPSEKSGPNRKVYRLTSIGKRVLNSFIKRNITEIFYKPDIKTLLKGDL